MDVDLRRDQVSLPVVTCSEHIFSLSLHTQDLSDCHCNERGLLGVRVVILSLQKVKFTWRPLTILLIFLSDV